MIVSLDFHDFSPVNHNLPYLKKLKEHYPNIKVTLFMPPFDMTKGKVETILVHQDFAKVLAKNRDWIEIGVHGFTHREGEMYRYDEEITTSLLQATENMFKKLKKEKKIDINWCRGFCAPHWQRTNITDKVLKKMGYWVAINDNANPEGLPFYKYNWSVNDPIPDLPIVRGHGHIQDVCGNGLVESFSSIMQIPEDAEFKFCSEVLQ